MFFQFSWYVWYFLTTNFFLQVETLVKAYDERCHSRIAPKKKSRVQRLVSHLANGTDKADGASNSDDQRYTFFLFELLPCHAKAVDVLTNAVQKDFWKNIKSNFRCTRGITRKRVTSGGDPGPSATSRRWRAAGDSVSI